MVVKFIEKSHMVNIFPFLNKLLNIFVDVVFFFLSLFADHRKVRLQRGLLKSVSLFSYNT